MNVIVTITLVLVCVCVSVTWSAKDVPTSKDECFHRFHECKASALANGKPAIMMRLCAFKFSKCGIPIFMRKWGLTEKDINPKELLRNGYGNVLDNWMDRFK
ncbi:hypothetical protein ScPMuIL_016908 [Solemya velum]